jgi:hypothetical protein
MLRCRVEFFDLQHSRLTTVVLTPCRHSVLLVVIFEVVLVGSSRKGGAERVYFLAIINAVIKLHIRLGENSFPCA